MKRSAQFNLSCVALLLLLAVCSSAAGEPAPGPNALQQQLIGRGYGMFIHYGVNTFNETEWSDGKLPVSSVAPTALDCDSWIKTAKEAGFRHVVLVTKHHDGYCNWPTKLTDYNVANSPVKTDVVGEVAKACKKYGVKLGLYYSLWDRHEPSFEHPPKYVEYMKGQLTELLSNYGPVCELWFDGPWKLPHPDQDYDIAGLYALIHRLQPDCAVTVNHTIGHAENNNLIAPDDFKQGDYVRFWPVDFRAKDPDIARLDDPKLFLRDGQLRYLPFEHTICISDRWNWFQKKDVLPARPVDELEELFYRCTANDNVLLVNLPPDRTGRLRANEVERVLELADRLGIRGGDQPLPARGPNLLLDARTSPAAGAAAVDPRWTSAWTNQDGSSLELTPAAPITFDTIAMVERADMKALGDKFSYVRSFHVKKFELEARVNGAWTTIHSGAAIGATLKIVLPRTTASALRLKVTGSDGVSGIQDIAAYDSKAFGLRGRQKALDVK